MNFLDTFSTNQTFFINTQKNQTSDLIIFFSNHINNSHSQHVQSTYIKNKINFLFLTQFPHEKFIKESI